MTEGVLCHNAGTGELVHSVSTGHLVHKAPPALLLSCSGVLQHRYDATGFLLTVQNGDLLPLIESQTYGYFDWVVPGDYRSRYEVTVQWVPWGTPAWHLYVLFENAKLALDARRFPPGPEGAYTIVFNWPGFLTYWTQTINTISNISFTFA